MMRASFLTLKNTLTLTVLTAALVALASPLVAQTADVRAKPITESEIQLLRKDVQTEKNQIITDAMAFTQTEAAAFWPIYKEYASAQHGIADKRLALITDYAQRLDKMDDAAARGLTDRMFAVEDATQALRKQYYPRFEKALGAKRAAKFYQVDNRLSLLINLQLAAEIPLIP
jgi:Spy/CpxP family protein refolding chaperone